MAIDASCFLQEIDRRTDRDKEKQRQEREFEFNITSNRQMCLLEPRSLFIINRLLELPIIKRR